MDLNYNLTFQALSQIINVPMVHHDIPSDIDHVMKEYEMGKMKTETFLWNLQRKQKVKTPQPYQLIKAWNKMLLGWNPKRFDFLEALKKDYKVYLLSNTNELHIEWVLRDLKKNHGITDFDTRYFDKTFYSHNMLMRKPDINIYQKLIEETKISPEESLFIDDNFDNVQGAKMAGLNAVVHDPAKEIIDELEGYLRNYI